MLPLYANIKRLRKKNGMSQEELAKKAGYTDRSSIAKIEKGEVDLSQSKIQAFADIFGVTPNDLMEEHQGRIFSLFRIPLYHLICCGNGGFVDDQIIDYISLPPGKLNPNKDYFAQTASGDSMIGANIHNGDILIFEKTGHIENGQIGCFCIDDNEAMCKRYKVTADGHIILMPANDKYDPIPVDITMEHFRCIGVLVYCIVDMKGM